MEQFKEVKVVFGDYSAESFALANAKISNVNMYKKTNTLELFLQPNELVPISEIEKFESYAKKRFNLNEVNLKFEYNKNMADKEDSVNIKDENNQISDGKIDYNFLNKKIETDWKEILMYTSKKVPVIKAFLKNSNIDIVENKINVHLGLKGKVLLEKQGINTYISDFIDNVYGKRYPINFIEENVEKTEDSFLEEKKIQLKQKKL